MNHGVSFLIFLTRPPPSLCGWIVWIWCIIVWHVTRVCVPVKLFISSRLFSRTDFYPAKEMHRAAILQVIWMDSNVVTTCRRALQCRTAITLSKNVLVGTELTWFILSYLHAYTQTIYLSICACCIHVIDIIQWATLVHALPTAQCMHAQVQIVQIIWTFHICDGEQGTRLLLNQLQLVPQID